MRDHAHRSMKCSTSKPACGEPCPCSDPSTHEASGHLDVQLVHDLADLDACSVTGSVSEPSA
eukprot:7387515-Prymnesium_polylepis.1